jgi:TPR repeat protein
MRGIIIFAVGIALSVSTVAVSAQSRGQEAPVTDCDAYAADPFDSNRKAIGVPYQKINPALAVPVCESAAREYPKSNRLAFQLGRTFDRKADYSSALVLYRQAAAQEYAAAQNALGVAYSLGNGVQKDDAQAVIWFRKAADQGNAAGQAHLAIAYETGQGLWLDNFQAAAWHRKAATQGVAASQVNLGNLYAKGLGVEKNEAEAAGWYQKAAAQGDMNGQHNLGVAYQYGLGVLKDGVQAIYWYRKAAEQGSEESKKKLAELMNGAEPVQADAQPAFPTRTPMEVAGQKADQLKSCIEVNQSSDAGVEIAKTKCRRELDAFLRACQASWLSIGHSPDVCPANAMVVIGSAIKKESPTTSSAVLDRLMYCVNPEIQHGQYSSYDGGTSVIKVLEGKCKREYLSFLQFCEQSGDSNSCVLSAAVATQLAIKQFGK